MAQAPPLSAQVNIGAASRYNTGHARCGVICYRRAMASLGADASVTKRFRLQLQIR